MRYVYSKSEAKRKEEAYRIYITDSLYYHSQNQRLTQRYADLIKPHKEIDHRSGDEIAMDIIQRLNLKFEGKEE